MPLKLAIQKKLVTNTDRVKAVDFHPSYPWVVSGLYDGHLCIHDYEKQSIIKTVDTSSLPVRSVKFVERKQWIVSAGDDMQVRVFNYNTMEKIKQFEAHSDYIRNLAIHSSLPYILTASDDMSVKLWNWEKDFQLVEYYESHAHYVMMVKWNPKDPSMFASASLDHSVKIWGVPAPSTSKSTSCAKGAAPHYSLTGHEKGINCIEYCPAEDKPYIITGSDDKTLRVWDYLSKQCIHVLSGHEGDITSITCHPKLPIMFSGSEDKSVRVWSMQTYREEVMLEYDLDRVWSIACTNDASSSASGKSNKLSQSGDHVAIGFDEGLIVLSLGDNDPIACMSGSKGVWAKGNEIQSFSLKNLDHIGNVVDGEKVVIPVKDLGTCEIFPQSVSFHPNGRYIVVCGDGEYIIYTSQAMRNKAFGKAIDFVWSFDGLSAIREKSGQIRVFENFEEVHSFTPAYPVLEIFGGALIGLKSPDFLCFYDWQQCRLVRKIELSPNKMKWREDGKYVALICNDSTYILKYDHGAVQAAIIAQTPDCNEGLEIAFDMEFEIDEKIESGTWVSNFFIFITKTLHIKIYFEKNTEPFKIIDYFASVFGYIQELNRLFLITKDLNITSYTLKWDFLQFKLSISQGDIETGEHHLALLPDEYECLAAKFYQQCGHYERAYELTTTLNEKVKLALLLRKLDECQNILEAYSIRKNKENYGTNSELENYETVGDIDAETHKGMWKVLGDIAMKSNRFQLAVEAFETCRDYESLFLLYSSLGDSTGLQRLGRITAKLDRNISLQCHIMLKNYQEIIDNFCREKNFTYAAYFARAYYPCKIADIVGSWKKHKDDACSNVTKLLADPKSHPFAFTPFNI